MEGAPLRAIERKVGEVDAGIANLRRAREIAVSLKIPQKIEAIDAAITATTPAAT